MFARIADSGRLRFAAGFTSALILLAVLAFSVSLALAGSTNVSATKAEDAPDPAPPATVFHYTINGTVGALAVTGLQVKDASIDDPQVVANSATWSLNGGGTTACTIGAGSNVTCTIGSAAASSSFEVIVTATIAATPDTACLNPNGSGTLDDTLRNAATVNWSDSDGGPFTITTNNITVKLDCTGSTLPTPTPSPTPTATATASPSGPTVTRMFGANRYATAAKVSQYKTPTPGVGVPAVYIATGLQFPDALAGAPAAHGDNAALLLVQQNAIPAETQAELTRIKPLKIYILGGTGVISTAVESALNSYDRGGGVVRLSGANRYATGAAIVAHAFPTTASSVILANGTLFPDALAGGAAAASNGMPLLLTQPGVIPAETVAQLNRLNPTTIYILGGTGSISTTVENQLKARGNHPTVTRVAGADRYATGIKISQQFFTASGHAHMWVATGVNFPDALAAGPIGEPLLLTPQAALPAGGATEATRLNPSSISVLGGPTIISDNVITQLQGT